MSDLQFLNEAYVQLSASSGEGNAFSYDIKEMKIFSDIQNPEFEKFLETAGTYAIRGKDVLRGEQVESDLSEVELELTDKQTLDMTYFIQVSHFKTHLVYC